MRQVTRKGLITMAAAGGVLALGGGHAHADSGAEGTAAKSPGVLSGNNVQVPVHVPVNVCGNTVDVVGVLNPAFGNGCANGRGPSSGGHGGGSHTSPQGGGPHHGGSHQGGSSQGGSNQGGSQHGGSHPGATHTAPAGGSHAEGGSANSPGVGSGNTIQVPIDIPVNACGNSVTIGGLLNPTMGNGCANDAPVAPPARPERPEKPVTPGKPSQPGKPVQVRAIPPSPNAPEPKTVVRPEGTETLAQTGAGALGIAVPVGAGLLIAGSLIYRRARSAA
ncbi:chaplin family protein [Streptomyces sp. NPDC059743]|uniref:chaplin n=1 Tax=Streptomyces sp. NPDC059743 TaxID=3346928 RepID=UPI003657555B